VGWARQPNGPSVQEYLEKALLRITKEKISVIGAGRTDAGVHAAAQVANFKTKASLKIEEFKRAINGNLPAGIQIAKAEEVPIKFHARFSAKWREYVYQIVIMEEKPIFLDRYTYHLRKKVNVKKMREAIRFLVGKHDFSAFAAGEEDHSRVRRLIDLEITQGKIALYPGVKERQAAALVFRVKANGFLRKMVRLMIGTLLEVGRGKISPDQVKQILKSKDNQLSGAAAPARGLILNKIDY
jgi:tRNA pseudouridine38-40 synthase